MLKITIKSVELYDEKKNLFSSSPEVDLVLEHSLVSISKWESKWCKPFLTKGNKTLAETIDYVKAMTLTQNVDPICYAILSQSNLDEIAAYIEAPMTATTFANENKPGSREIITSELIYYWMVAYQIPFECQKWHLNRLLTLINVCSIKNQPKKKMNRKDLSRRNKMLNDQRRASMGTTG